MLYVKENEYHLDADETRLILYLSVTRFNVARFNAKLSRGPLHPSPVSGDTQSIIIAISPINFLMSSNFYAVNQSLNNHEIVSDSVNLNS